jgi:hypothetical protein
VQVSREDRFHLWLDQAWPLWKQHVGSVHYMDLRRAYYAGLEDHAPASATRRTNQQDADFARLILKTLRENPYPTLGGTATWQSVELWAEDFLRRSEVTAK